VANRLHSLSISLTVCVCSAGNVGESKKIDGEALYRLLLQGFRLWAPHTHILSLAVCIVGSSALNLFIWTESLFAEHRNEIK
jgi:hypothetical protein